MKHLVYEAPGRLKHEPRPPARRIAEVAGAGALLGIAAVHLLDLSGKFAEVPYLGVAYVGLIAGTLGAAGMLLRGDRRGWRLGGALALATIIAFVLSRTTGLPGATDDIVNWSEPLGVSSLLGEAAVVLLAALSLRPRAASEAVRAERAPQRTPLGV
jgi:hypothetical protein